ncbi:MAG: ABC transporter permease, partial [Hymenobacteraceae bacterium]|nr:ABC transporter permease [Hymenobacteraceae bacterium]
QEFLTPRSSASEPLIKATNHFQVYRKGPFAMYALQEYIGEKNVNAALRNLLQKHKNGEPPLPVSLDLLHELKAVTPDSMHYLLSDLFKQNTFWELETKRAVAKQTDAGNWLVTLDVQARKVAIDTAGNETERPLHDWVEIGIYASENTENEKPLYLKQHRINSGRQTITVVVPEKPTVAGVDPRFLLIDQNMEDNLKKLTFTSAKKAPGVRLTLQQ